MQARQEREKVTGKIPGLGVVASDDETGSANNKNAKKRAAKKRAKEAAMVAEAATSVNAAPTPAGKSATARAIAATESATPTAVTASATTTTTPPSTAAPTPQEDRERQAKAIRKKIRQANDLKTKKDNGENLLPEQMEKVVRIAELMRQLKELGLEDEK